MYKRDRRAREEKRYEPEKIEVFEPKRAGAPKQTESKSGEIFSRKPFTGLRLGASITTKANPYQDAALQSQPYNVVGENSPVIDVNYGDKENLSGNILTRILSDENSTLLNTFDAFSLGLKAKYRHVDISAVEITKNGSGKVTAVKIVNPGNVAYNLELVKAIEDSISKGYAETFTQLPIMSNLTVKTKTQTYNSNKATFYVYSGLVTLPEVGDAAPTELVYEGSKGLLALLLAYQTYLQSLHLALSKYNKLMAMEQHLKDVSFNRDDVTLNQVYGLLKKSSFVSALKGLATTVKGEYLDIDWLSKVAKFALVPSRKSAGMVDPLLDINARYQWVPIVFSIGEFSADTSEWYDGIGDFSDDIEPYEILKWARRVDNGLENITPTAYYNKLTDAVDEIVAASYVFKSEVTELRTLLDVFNRVGLTRWSKGAVINIMTNIPQYRPVYNVTVHDIYRAMYSGDPVLAFNDVTMRWQIHSLWNKYTGIPQFERFYDGQQLIFSSKRFPVDEADPGHITSKYLVPQLFVESTSDNPYDLEMLNRVGVTFGVVESDPTDITDANYTGRFDLLKQGFKVSFPLVIIAGEGKELIRSYALAALESVFGVSGIKLDVGEPVYMVNVSNDIIGYVDVELESTVNEMISYAKTYGPFNPYMGS